MLSSSDLSNSSAPSSSTFASGVVTDRTEGSKNLFLNTNSLVGGGGVGGTVTSTGTMGPPSSLKNLGGRHVTTGLRSPDAELGYGSADRPKGDFTQAFAGRLDLSAWNYILHRKDPLLLAFNFCCAVALIFINKLVFTKAGFHFSTALSLIHYVVTWLILMLLRTFGVFHHQTRPLSPNFWWLCAVVGMDTPLNNLSLKLNSIGMYQVIKLLVTPAIVMLEYFLYTRRISRERTFFLVMVSVGVGIATVGDVQSTPLGTCVAMSWVVVAAAKKVLWHHAERSEGWQTLPLMLRVYPYAMIWCAASCPFLDPSGVMKYNFTMQRVALLAFSGLGAFFVSYSAFRVVGSCSPLTHVLLGQMKSVVAMVGGYLLFNQHYGSTALVGCGMAMLGVILYTDANLKENISAQSSRGSHSRPAPMSPSSPNPNVISGVGGGGGKDFSNNGGNNGSPLILNTNGFPQRMENA